MDCKHIRERLPAYREEDVGLEEKRAIGQHLSSCQQCSRALDDLKKAEKLVKRLPEVEAPAWMTQKVMARVRAEEEKKKGIVQHLFFPLRIKIPVQVFATVVIAVAAIYVFKAVEPQMKPVAPSAAPEQGIAKEASPDPSPATRKGPEEYRVSGSEVAVQKSAKPAEKEKGARRVDESSRDSLEAERRVASESKEGLSIAAADKIPPAEAGSQPVAPKKRELLQDRMERSASVSPSPSQETLPSRQSPPEVATRQREALAEKDVLAGEVHMGKTLAAPAALKAAAKEPRQVGVTIHVGDVKSASGEIQGLLRRLGARRVEQESLQNSVILTTEVQAEKLKELFDALKPIGDLKEKSGVPDISQGEIARITIEVIHQP
jgi:hypothetical protein